MMISSLSYSKKVLKKSKKNIIVKSYELRRAKLSSSMLETMMIKSKATEPNSDLR